MLVSLSVAACPGRVRGAVLLGDPDIVFGVIVLCLVSPGLVRSVEGPSCDRTEYGPAVAGLAATSGLRLAGRIGAVEIPPWDDAAVSGRVRVADFVALEVVVLFDAEECARTGSTAAIAEPGLEGGFLVARAFFWAIIVSLSEGFELVIVLFDRPKPGRAGAAASGFLGELGFAGSFCSSF